MVPMKRLTVKEYGDKNGEDCQRNNLLYHLQLHKGVRSAITHKTNPVGRNLTAVFKEGYAPRKGNHTDERP